MGSVKAPSNRSALSTGEFEAGPGGVHNGNLMVPEPVCQPDPPDNGLGQP
jgi:hypothetical protein